MSSGEFRSIKILSQKGIVPRWHSVATQDAWLQHSVLLLRHTCVAQRQMSRRGAGVAQRSAADGFGCGADVGKGWTRSQGRGGRGIDSVQLQMWGEGGLGPVAEVGGYEPSPVVSDERSPKCRHGRIGVSRTKLRCAAHTQRTYMRPAHRAEEGRQCTARLMVPQV